MKRVFLIGILLMTTVASTFAFSAITGPIVGKTSESKTAKLFNGETALYDPEVDEWYSIILAKDLNVYLLNIDEEVMFNGYITKMKWRGNYLRITIENPNTYRNYKFRLQLMYEVTPEGLELKKWNDRPVYLIQ